MPMDESSPCNSLIIQVLQWSHASNLAINWATLFQAWNIALSVFAAMPSTVEELLRHQTPNVSCHVVVMRARSVVLATD